MAHSYLDVDISKLSDDIVNQCSILGRISDNKQRLLTAGYTLNDDGSFLLVDGKKVMAHSSERMYMWVDMLTNEPVTLNELISTANELTKDEVFLMYRDINSPWYSVQDLSIDG